MTSACLVSCMSRKKRHKKSLGGNKTLKEFAKLELNRKRRLFMSEHWKDVVGYEGYYQVSNKGRVRGLKYVFWAGCCFRTLPERILKPNRNKSGYYYVVLHKNRKGRTWKIHRLVALAFVPNPEKKPCIDHINTIRTDNRVENLRWVTYKENVNNPITKRRVIKSAKKGLNIIKENKDKYDEIRLKSVRKPILCIETNVVYESITKASKELNINFNSLAQCLQGIRNRKTAGGYHWKYIDNN